MAANKRKILEAARKHAQKGAKEKALKEFGKLLKLDPRDSKVRLEMGDTHRRWGHVAEAIEAYSVVADQFMTEGFDARAVAVFKQIQNLQPDSFAYHEPLAELYQRMGLTAEAIGSLEAAAETYRKAGQKQEALGLLRKMAAIDPSNTTSRIKVADLLQQEGMKEEAISEYDAVVAELEQQGDTEAAAKLFERILEIEPDRVETIVLYAKNLTASGSTQRAEALAKRALELDKNPDHYELLADVYRMQHRDEDLIVLYRELAELYRERGDEERTREILQRYVPLDDIGAAETPNGYIDENEELLDEKGIDDLSVGDETTLLDGDLLSDPSLLVSDDDSGLGILHHDDDLDELGAADLDLITDSNEMTTLLPDEPSAGASSGDSGGGEAAVDANQLLAEASVYLRYGKRAQAVANLESILEQDSNHRLALEKLGEALVEGEEPAKAVEMWSRAAVLAAAAGEGDSAEVLRSRIAALDASAAEALDLSVAPEPEPVGRSVAEDLVGDSSDDLSMSAGSDEMSASGGSEDSDEEDLPELDLADVSISGMNIEIDVDDASFSEDALDEAPSDEFEAEPDTDELRSMVDADAGEIGIDDLMNVSDTQETGEVEADAESSASGAVDHVEIDVDDVASDGEAAAGAASEDGEIDSEALTAGGVEEGDPSPEKIAEELEEADFYMEQGLLDEAESVYSRILSIAPNNPHAMVRLGELAARRGDASESTEAASESSDALADSTDPIERVAEASAESDIGADLADWQEGSPSDEAEESDGATESLATDSVESEESTAAEGLGAEAEADALDTADIPDENEESLAGAELVAPESDLAADLGIEEAADSDLASESGEDAPAIADEPDETADAPSVSQEPDVAEAAEESEEPDAAKAAEESEEPEPVAAVDSSIEESPETLESEASSEGDDDDFGFDLAAELSESFDQDPDATGAGSTGSGSRGDTSEDGFASVFAEFKKGVSETLNEGDHQAHYDLGIAYREMGLLNDAITELRMAMGDAGRRVGCLHLMGMCASDMGEPEQAIGHFTEALASDGITEETALAVKLDLGAAHAAVGDPASARRTYEEIQAIDSDYADVVSRIEELAKPEEDDPEDDGSQETEEYETFAEFLGDLDEGDADDTSGAGDSASGAEEEPAWETFDDVVAEVDAEDAAESASQEAESPPDVDESEPEAEKTPKRKKKKISFV